MDERAGSIQNKNATFRQEGKGRSMSEPERKWMKGQGSIQNKNITFRQEGKADQ